MCTARVTTEVLLVLFCRYSALRGVQCALQELLLSSPALQGTEACAQQDLLQGYSWYYALSVVLRMCTKRLPKVLSTISETLDRIWSTTRVTTEFTQATILFTTMHQSSGNDVEHHKNYSKV